LHTQKEEREKKNENQRDDEPHRVLFHYFTFSRENVMKKERSAKKKQPCLSDYR